MKICYLFDIDCIERYRYPLFPKLPNHALMKMSTYFKQKGYKIRLICFKQHIPTRYRPNDLYIGSCLYYPNLKRFKKRLSMVKNGLPFDKIHIGTPTDECPITDIPHLKVDYTIYDEQIEKYGLNLEWYPVNVGFLTRGCKRHCSFCVNRDKNEVTPVNTLEEIYQLKGYDIELLDDNLLASNNAIDYLRDIKRFHDKTGVNFRLRNGLDLRVLKDDVLKELVDARSAFRGGYHCAWDNVKNTYIFRNIKRLKEAGVSGVTCYMLFGVNIYSEEELYKDLIGLFYRFHLVRCINNIPYVALFEDDTGEYVNPYIDKYKTIKYLFGIMRTNKRNTIYRNCPQNKLRIVEDIINVLGDNSWLVTKTGWELYDSPDFNDKMRSISKELGVKHYDIKKELIK